MRNSLSALGGPRNETIGPGLHDTASTTFVLSITLRHCIPGPSRSELVLKGLDRLQLLSFIIGEAIDPERCRHASLGLGKLHHVKAALLPAVL